MRFRTGVLRIIQIPSGLTRRAGSVCSELSGISKFLYHNVVGRFKLALDGMKDAMRAIGPTLGCADGRSVILIVISHSGQTGSAGTGIGKTVNFNKMMSSSIWGAAIFFVILFGGQNACLRLLTFF